MFESGAFIERIGPCLAGVGLNSFEPEVDGPDNGGNGSIGRAAFGIDAFGIDIHLNAEPDLAKVALAGNGVGGGFGAGQGREEKTGEDGDNRNDDEEFDEGKCLSGARVKVRFHAVAGFSEV